MRHVAATVALVALIAAVYGASAGHRFVFDDQLLVVENPAVRLPLDRAGELLSGGVPGVAYRPLRIFSYMVDYRIAGGLDPAVFHRSNLAYHAAVTLALYALAAVTIGSAAGALAAAAVFAVHPLGSEAVVYVSGRRDLLSALFTIVALLCWCGLLASVRRSSARAGVYRAPRLGAGGWVALAAMLAFGMLALASKENALVLPLLAILLWLAQRGRTPRRRAASPLWVGIAASVAVLAGTAVWLYGRALGPHLGALASGDALAPQPALSVRVLAQYLRLAVWPLHLSADYRPYAFELPTSALDAGTISIALVLLAVVALGVVLLARGSVAGAGLLWFFAALLPVAQIVPYREVIAEHNAYLALAGLALAAGQAVAVASRSRPRLVAAVATCAVLLLGIRSHVRARDWSDDLTLWRATLATAPRSVRANFNYGVALLREGKLLEARDALETAQDLDPRDRDVLVTLASLSGRLGEFERAHELAERAVAERRDAESLTMLGWAQLSLGQPRAAMETFDAAIALGGDTSEAERGLARARIEGGRF